MGAWKDFLGIGEVIKIKKIYKWNSNLTYSTLWWKLHNGELNDIQPTEKKKKSSQLGIYVKPAPFQLHRCLINIRSIGRIREGESDLLGI